MDFMVHGEMEKDNPAGETPDDGGGRGLRASVVVWILGAAVVLALWWFAWQAYAIPACEAEGVIRPDGTGPRLLTPCQQAIADAEALLSALPIILSAAMLGTLLLAVTGAMLRRKR